MTGENGIQDARLEALCKRLEQAPVAGARRQPRASQRLSDGVWGARLVDLLRGLYGDYERVREPWEDEFRKGLFDGSLYERHLAVLGDIEHELAQGVLAKEPSMLFLAARCGETCALTDCWSISFDGRGVLEGPSWSSPLESTRELYLLACENGSLHALLYVAWLLDTGNAPDLFARDERLARRLVGAVRAAYEPLEVLLFPELAAIDDPSDIFSITVWLEFYEEGYGRPLGRYPRPQPRWGTWHKLLLDLDEVLEAWLWPEPELPAFEAWCAGTGMLMQRSEG